LNISAAPDSGAGAQATRVRWLVLLLMSLMYLITYMDRSNISVAAPAMTEEFGLSKTEFGIVFSAFLWAYSLGQIPGGWLADRYGARKVLLFIVPFWSFMTVATALAFGRVSLIATRFVFGLGEAGAFPTATRAMQLWFPPSERGLVQGVTHSFSRLAVAIVPFISVSILLAFGWRWIFYSFGCLGLVWAGAFALSYRNLPEDHEGVNRAELAHIRGRNPDGSIQRSGSAQAAKTPPWKRIFGSPNMWYIAAAYGCFFYGTYFYVTWFPTYLLEYRHLSLQAVGVFASLPFLAGIVGDVAGGSLTDLLYRRTGHAKLARRAIAAPAMLASAACLVPAATTGNEWTALGCLTASFFFLEMVIGPAWAVPMDVGGEYSGTVTGVMNMAGSLSASMSPIVFGFLVEKGSWRAPFFITAAILVAGSLIWAFLIDPEASVVAAS
jgi:sugar phosphate permease